MNNSTPTPILALILALALAGCASPPEIRHQVVVPPPPAPRAEFFLEKVQVQSRETGAEVAQRNEDYARALAESLKQALLAREKTLAPPPADSIKPKLYLAYAPVPAADRRNKRAGARVEVRLELVDAASGKVSYSTHTETEIAPSLLSKVGWAPEADQLIREVIEKSAKDFVSRL